VRWVVASIITLVLWGVWGVLLKRVSVRGEWWEVYVATNSAIVVVLSAILVWKGMGSIVSHGVNWLALAFITGAMGTLGYIFLVLALNWGGKASIVVPLTSLYPAVTAVLSLLVLGESITLRQGLGIVLAVIAIVLLSS
jgi:transporter family protein